MGLEFELAAKVLPKEAANKKVVYSSSNESIATVSQTGAVEVVGEGTAFIRAASAENPQLFVMSVVTSKKLAYPYDAEAGGSSSGGLFGFLYDIPYLGPVIKVFVTIARLGVRFLEWLNSLSGYKFTLEYKLLTDSVSTNYEALLLLNKVRPVFQNKFSVDLVQRENQTSGLDPRPGCKKLNPRSSSCDESCGALAQCAKLHHRSADHLYYSGYTEGVNTFRFVDYRMCMIFSNGTHGSPEGLAWPWGDGTGEILVTTATTENKYQVTAHEVSHLFGADDGVCDAGERCVMTPGSNTHDKWCDSCAATIKTEISRLS